MKHSNRYSPELRERAVPLVLDHQGEHESHPLQNLSATRVTPCIDPLERNM